MWRYFIFGIGFLLLATWVSGCLFPQLSAEEKRAVIVCYENRTNTPTKARLTYHADEENYFTVGPGAEYETGLAWYEMTYTRRRFYYLLDDYVIVELDAPDLDHPDSPYILTVYGCKWENKKQENEAEKEAHP